MTKEARVFRPSLPPTTLGKMRLASTYCTIPSTTMTPTGVHREPVVVYARVMGSSALKRMPT